MSQDYFVNRQDRYILFKDCKQLADFFTDVINTTTNHSFTLGPRGSTRIPSGLTYDPLYSRRTARDYKAALGLALQTLSGPTCQEAPSFAGDLDTVVFPLLQAGFCGIRQDEKVTSRLFLELDKEESLYIASGYFNLPSVYIKSILKSQGPCSILAASPQVKVFSCFMLRFCLYTRLDVRTILVVLQAIHRNVMNRMMAATALFVSCNFPWGMSVIGYYYVL